MCRLLALPPGATPAEAYAAIVTLEGSNKDGVGVGYWRNDGTAAITKYPEAVSEVIKKKLPLFDHMPHDGWTVAHTRFGTHGENTYENTHPFLIGDYIFAHNGVFNEALYCRIALNGLVQFKGDTDSEVAGWLLNKYGPERFTKLITTGGVYFGLHKSGELHIVKSNCTSDLELAACDDDDNAAAPEGQVVIASEIDWEYQARKRECNTGLFKFDKSGFIISSAGTSEPWKPQSYTRYRGDNDTGYGCGTAPFINGRLFAEESYCKDKGTGGVKKILESGKKLGLWNLDPEDYVVSLIDGK